MGIAPVIQRSLGTDLPLAVDPAEDLTTVVVDAEEPGRVREPDVLERDEELVDPSAAGLDGATDGVADPLDPLDPLDPFDPFDPFDPLDPRWR